MVGAGVEQDVTVLGRLKREFAYFCLDLYEEQEVAVVAGGRIPGTGSTARVERYDVGTDSEDSDEEIAKTSVRLHLIHFCQTQVRLTPASMC